jgi:hypothetical protein
MRATQSSPMDTLYRLTTAVFALIVLVQALLAGQGLFIDIGLIRTHGFVGNLTFIVVVVLSGLAVATRQLRTGIDLGLVAVALVLVVAQIGLGYAGRESASAASWHVPNGVLIFGSSVAILTRAFAPRVVAAMSAGPVTAGRSL